MLLKIGQGFDVHGFEPGKPMRLAGLTLPCDYGLKGHSDGDVIIHAICDALLGAAGLGDIGEHFPDSDPQYKQADSRQFLSKVLKLVETEGFAIANVDVTVIAQKPRIGPFKKQMRENLATLLHCQPAAINIKATTTEAMGFIGREEGMAAMAIVLLTSDHHEKLTARAC